MHYSRKGNINRKEFLRRKNLQMETMEEQERLHRLAIQRKRAAEATAKAQIDAPDSVHEKQADDIGKKVANNENAADLVKNHPKAEVSKQTSLQDDRNTVPEVTSDIQTKLDSTKGGGKNLDEHTKTAMEQNMGVDLSGVKIHTDSKANELSESINAKAFTHEQDVYFKEGNFNTESKEGKELLGHELAHTVQQKGSGVSRKIQRKAIDPETKKDFVKLKEPQFCGTDENYAGLFSDALSDSTYERIIPPHMGMYAYYQSKDKKWLYVIWEKKYKGYVLSNEVNLLGKIDENAPVYRDRIIQRFGPIVKKYDIEDVMFHLNSDDLLRMEKLLFAIEPYLMNDLSTETSFLDDGKRYSVQIGADRLIIIDAGKSIADYHQFHYALNDKKLSEHFSKKDAKNDTAFNLYKQKYLRSVTQEPSIKNSETTDTENQKVNYPTPQLNKLRYNSDKMVVLNIPPLDYEALEFYGIEPQGLSFKYEDRGAFFEMTGSGGSRYHVEYYGAYIGIIDVQQNKYVRGNIDDFNKTYADQLYTKKVPRLWNEMINGEVFKISYSVGIGGDPDLIQVLADVGIKNHKGVINSLEDAAVFSLLDVDVSGLRSFGGRGKRFTNYQQKARVNPTSHNPEFTGTGKSIKGPKNSKVSGGTGKSGKTMSRIKALSNALKLKFNLKSNFVSIGDAKYDLGAGKKQVKEGKWLDMNESDVAKVQKHLANLEYTKKLVASTKHTFNNHTFDKSSSPVTIPSTARIQESVKSGNYTQVRFRFTKDGFNYEVRWHTAIPNTPGAENGNTWVVMRTRPGKGGSKPASFFLSGKTWVTGKAWYDAIAAQKAGTATDAQKLMLKNGHFKSN